MISLFGSNVGKEELAAIEECFERQWLGIGPRTAEFEKAVADKIGSGFVFLNSGSNSLHLALRLLNLPEGSEVILPSFTWIACANAVLLNKLKPVFCDVDPSTCNVTAELISRKITKKTGAIMVVHYGGKPCDMDPINALGIPVLEDAAHAIDSYYKGKHCGAIGALGIFSFDAVKNLTTGEGGGVICKDPALQQKAKNLRYCGISKSGFEASATKNRWWEYDVNDSFPKMLNTDMAASMGLQQLKKLPSFQARRKELWDTYTKHFNEPWAQDWLEHAPGPEAHEQHSYFSYFIHVKTGSRDALAKFLYDRGVYTSLRYHPLHMNKIYGSTDQRLEHSEWLNEHALNLPLHHRLKDSEVEQIFDGIKAFRQKHV